MYLRDWLVQWTFGINVVDTISTAVSVVVATRHLTAAFNKKSFNKMYMKESLNTENETQWESILEYISTRFRNKKLFKRKSATIFRFQLFFYVIEYVGQEFESPAKQRQNCRSRLRTVRASDVQIGWSNIIQYVISSAVANNKLND